MIVRYLMMSGMLLLVQTAAATPDLWLTARWQYATATVGERVDLTLTLRNAGTSPAGGVTVTDQIPEGLYLLGNHPDVGSYHAGQGRWTVGTVAAGDSLTLRLTFRPDAAGNFDYMAQVATQLEPDADSTPGNAAGNPQEDDEATDRLRVGSLCIAADTLVLADVICADNGTSDLLDDYYTVTVRIGGTTGTGYTLVSTGPFGALSQGVQAGNDYLLPVQVPIGSPTRFELTETASGTCYSSTVASPGACSQEVVCYAASDVSSDEALFRYSSLSNTWTRLGSTNVTQIEALAYDYIRDTIYTVNDEVFGFLDSNTGNFTPLSTAMGNIDGPNGTENVSSVDGLTYDHSTERFWASERREGSATDLDYIFQIDRYTGQPVLDAFGPGQDYIVAQAAIDPSNGNLLRDIDDLALDPRTGELYAIANQGGAGDALVVYDKTNGNVLRTVSDFSGISDMEGMSFFNGGRIATTTGNSSANPNDNDRFYTVSTATGEVQEIGRIDPTGSAQDFEASDCLTGEPNYLSGNFFLDANESGDFQTGEPGDAAVLIDVYYDVDADGRIDPAIDKLIQTKPTNTEGNYEFYIATTGNFLIQPRPATVPPGRNYTTTDLHRADFFTMGNSDLHNNFGSVNGCVITSTTVLTVACERNGTPYDGTDDRMRISLDVSGNNTATHYRITPSSGTIDPAVVAYGSTQVTLTNPGAAGAGNVILYLTDLNAPACTAEVYIDDPGNCPCPQICLPVQLTRTFE